MERPTGQNREAWRCYWDDQGQSWRSEPEIHPERQRLLAERRSDSARSSAPFAGMRLDRADVEWLLATHQHRGLIGPVDGEDPRQRTREGIDLQEADLRQAKLGNLPLARTNFGKAQLDRTNFAGSHLERANFVSCSLIGASFNKAWLTDASFREAVLRDTLFTEAHLESANLYGADCTNASFYIAHLEGAYIGHAIFAKATLRRSFCDAATSFNDAVLWDEDGVSASLADVHWNEGNLATLDWSHIIMIGDEREARSRLDRDGKPKTREKWQDNYRRAVRANRQLAVALRAQGMNEEADHFAYCAQVCQRLLYRHQRRPGAAFGSGFLDLMAGYGFKPLRTLWVYILIILVYAAVYYAEGSAHLSPLAALIFSLTSFHGRGFFPGTLALDDTLTVLAATQAITGLIVEATFIATFTQRFFSR